ncbi:MAG: transporter substrate-binding domain-containing protein [Lachnospiraceae bacterium]|nr:transporter substrate-binding domain-containing protein [Lachnospiraceae bacterium]
MKKTLLKRFLTTGLTFALLTVGLSGCGNSGDASTSGSSGDAGAASAESTADSRTAEQGNTDAVTIYAATSGSTNPYTTVDENNNVTGYDCEILKEAFSRLPQYDLEFVVTDFASIFSGVTSGTYQIACNNFSYNAERSESYLYSYPYDKISYVFVTKKDAKPVTTFADAAGLTFEGSSGVSVTTAVEKWNEDNPDQTINISYTEAETPVMLQHIEDGSVDFGIIDLAMYVAYQDQYQFNIQKNDITDEDAKKIAENNYAYYLYSYDNKDLRDEVNTVLKEMEEDGTISRISQEWFGQDTAPEKELFEETIN